MAPGPLERLAHDELEGLRLGLLHGKLSPAEKEETILYADVEPAALVGPRFQLDVAGHYARPDVFRLLVDERPKRAVEAGEIDLEEADD